METINKAKQSVSEMQEQLIDYLAAGEDTQDLTHLFSKLAVENPIVYELMLLMYQEFQTKSKLDRKRLTKVIASILNQNNIVYDKLIHHELRLNNDTANDLAPRQIQQPSSVAQAAPIDAQLQPQVQPQVQLTPITNIYEMFVSWMSPKVIQTTIISLTLSFVVILASLTVLALVNPDLYAKIINMLGTVFSSAPKKS